MFKRPATHYGKSPQPETPYQRAAQVWDDRIGSARVQARNWRFMAFGSLALSMGLSAALVWQSTNGSIVPWVVQVDRLGQAQAVAPATADYQPNDPQIAFYLARFIEQVRSIPADAIIVRQNWLRAYDFTTQAGAGAQRLCPRQRSLRQGRQTAGRGRGRRSFAPRRRASASPGSSAAIRTALSPPNAGPPSSPSPCSRRATPTR
jgi:hypothetical protein